MASSKSQLHEDFSRDEVPQASERSFGFVFAGFFTLVALLPLVRGHAWRPWALGVAAVFLVLALVAPAVLRPLNRVWMALGALLNRIVAPVVLGVIFYLIFTPFGLLMRVFGKRPLALDRDPSAPSYWIVREPSASAEGMKQQF
jgi:hypothetical protein